MGAGLLRPEATTSMSAAPYASAAAATDSSCSSDPEARSRFAPIAPRAMETARPNAPDAPTTMAERPETSNSESGFLRISLLIVRNVCTTISYSLDGTRLPLQRANRYAGPLRGGGGARLSVRVGHGLAHLHGRPLDHARPRGRAHIARPSRRVC